MIGGWFITAGAAFTICFIVALLIYWGGIPALVAMIGLAIYSLVRSHFAYKAKLRKEALKEEVNSTVSKLRKATDTREALALFMSIAVRNYNPIWILRRKYSVRR